MSAHEIDSPACPACGSMLTNLGCLQCAPPPSPAPVPPSLHFSPNVVEDNRIRESLGLPIVRRGRWKVRERGEKWVALGPSGETP